MFMDCKDKNGFVPLCLENHSIARVCACVLEIYKTLGTKAHIIIIIIIIYILYILILVPISVPLCDYLCLFDTIH